MKIHIAESYQSKLVYQLFLGVTVLRFFIPNPGYMALARV